MRQPSIIIIALLTFVFGINALAEVREEHVMIPMRDGVRLSAYLYFPPGDGPWPPIFEQRYASIAGKAARESAARLASGGYVVALVNYRGTHESEGVYVAYRALQWGELRDGYDVCEWLAKQPWSTGKAGTFGSSQGGYAQNYLAVTQPPSLVCQYMVDTGLSLFHEGYRIGGTTRPERFKGMAANCRNPADNDAVLKEWFAHPHYDEYWEAEDCTRHFDKMNVPCFTIGSWYDFMNQGSIASFVGRQRQGGPESRGRQKLLIGPWLHGRSNKGSKVGDLQYPDNAAWPVEEHMLEWFDFWLKGKQNGVMDGPPVRYYVMGANEWRTAPDWPPPARETPLYLQAGGGLSAETPVSAGSTSYVSDPRNPMQIPGRAFPGARDARPFEEQAEVRTFTTEPLAEPVEWTGRVFADLHVSSTARDTDFIVRVSDVYPDGRSILIIDYPWRMRYREGFDHEVLMEPGEVCRLQFPVGWLSQVFAKGHRIRVTVASTGAPLYEPNPQTGEPLTIEFPSNAVSATNTIHHAPEHPSRILAPVAVKPKPKTGANPVLAPIEDVPGLPRALIVGDSISMGYTLPVRELLEGKANVHRVPANAASAANGLKNFDTWIAGRKWDVIHFNFGLHDAKLPPEGTRHAPPEVYREHLREFVARLKETGAKLIWATTTPVPNGGILAPNRRFGDIAVYNKVALEVMRENGVAIDDLNQLIAPRVDEFQKPMDVHFTGAGSDFLAEQVARIIAAELAK